MAVEDGFSPEPEIQIPPVSPLLAMGTSPSRFGRRWIIAIGALFTIILGGICFTLLCSATFSLPTDTVFFATARPKILNQLLTTEQKNSLPAEWLTTIQEKSSWPVVLGLSGTGHDLRPFVIGPRWAIPMPLIQNQTDTKYLIRQIGLTADRSTSNESDVVYRDRFFSHVFQAGAIQGWFDPSIFFRSSPASGQVRFFFKDGQFVLNDKREEASTKEALPANTNDSTPLQTDFSLHLAAIRTTVQTDPTLSALPLGEVTPLMTSLGQSPAVIYMDFSDANLAALQFEFDQPLSTNEQMALRSFFEQTTEKQALTLPDGTVAMEKIAKSSDFEISSSTLVTPTLVKWRSASSAPAVAATPCANGTWLMRLSPEVLARLIPPSSRFSAWLPSRALQMWQTEQGSLICFES